MKPSFGDTVRILPSSETDLKTLSGRVGSVYGETTPSVTGVEVVGDCPNDYALNVHFDELAQSFWFAPALVEFVDHKTGSELSLDGVNKKWIRNDSSEWEENSSKKPWWRFWA
ncbi:hypothetical protein [Luteolibacter sp. AS25]|uniref:hypothetical protein n=1 Tax=Luteolibacter sp. AS25 TaxID=3135776 RepID=UPI00398B7934